METGRYSMTQKLKFLAAVICCGLLAIVFYNHFHGDGEKQDMRRNRPLVRVEEIHRADMMRHVNLSGQTVADADIVLAPKYTGRVVEVYVKLGDRVHKGDVLLRQDMGDVELAIRENQAAAQAAEAEALVAEATYNANYLKVKNDFELEQRKYDRNEYLFRIGAISQETLDSVKQEYLASKAAFEILENQASNGEDAASVMSKRFAAEKAVQATAVLEKQREDLLLRAPRDGVIGYRNVEVGEIISAGTKVLSLVDNHNIYVDCTLSEGDAAILHAGDSLPVSIDAVGRTYEGKIVYVSPAMDESSKTYTVRIELRGEDSDQLKAGLFARGHLDILQRSGTLFVPKEAVYRKNGRPAIFVLNSDGTVEERMVEIGLLNDVEEEILSGLSDGETVVLNNQDKLQTGTAVDLSEAES